MSKTKRQVAVRGANSKPPTSAIAESRQNHWQFAIIVGLCVLSFWNSLGGAFVWDDEIQILKNWRLRDLSNLPLAFTSAFWSFLGPSIQNQTNYYRPFQTIVYMLAYAAGGLSPYAFHVFNLAFHVAACLFVYLLALELLNSQTAALIVSALFAVHPVHTEPVDWIAGLPDVACGAFYFASLWAFLKFRRTARPSWQLLACALFLGGLLFKEMAITLPICIMLLQWLKPEYRLNWRENLRSVALFAVPILIYLPVRIHALGIIATSQINIEATLADWISLGIRAFVEYLRYSLLPYPLKAFHMLPLHLSDTVGQTMLSVLIIGLISATLVYFRKRIPDALLWFILFAVMLTPVFYFKGISAAFVAERYLYIPSFAILMLIASLMLRLPKVYYQSLLWSVVAVFALATAYRNDVWANDEKLYAATLKVQPEVSHMRINLADIYLKRKDDAGAKELLESALRYLDDSRFAQFPFERYRAHVGLGAISARAGNFADARQHFETAIKIQPNGDWGYLYLGGVVLEQDRDVPRAIDYFKKAIELSPINEVARDYMGVAMIRQGNYKEAVSNFEEALRINPTYEDARTHLKLASGLHTP